MYFHVPGHEFLNQTQLYRLLLFHVHYMKYLNKSSHKFMKNFRQQNYGQQSWNSVWYPWHNYHVCFQVFHIFLAFHTYHVCLQLFTLNSESSPIMDSHQWMKEWYTLMFDSNESTAKLLAITTGIWASYFLN